MIADTPQPPYYAVIFTTIRSDNDEGYEEMADKMHRLARQQPGFLGLESGHDTIGITVSYWDNLDAIRSWKHHADHFAARDMGRQKWYKSYHLRIARVERAYSFHQEE